MIYVKSQENKEPDKIGKGGYVKDLLTFMVMDNLVVKPMSNSIFCITLLNSCDVKDLGALETVEVYIGKNEVHVLFVKILLVFLFMSEINL